MLLFKNRTKQIEAQRWVLKLLNNHVPDVVALTEGPRLENRVNLTIPAWLIPWENGPVVSKAFPVVSKEFSPSGMALVINRPFAAENVLVGFQWPDDRRFLRTTVKHVDPLGAGFSQVGLQLVELICASDYPELDVLHF